jgi:hypothetical protein
VLGPLTVLRDGKPVELATKLRALLAHLIAIPSHRLTFDRWQLIVDA